MIRPYTSIVAVALMALTLSGAAGAEEYVKGHGALQVFDAEGIAKSPQWVQAWIFYVMLPTFALGLIFVWWRPIARFAVGGFLCSMLLGGPIFQALGLPYLSGAIAIAHIVFWSPALVLLLSWRPFLDGAEAIGYRLWSALMTFVILFSFVFDIRDAAIYIDHIAGIGMLS